ncbi:MAG: hypothetical protein A2144_02360 [Chloroflexi bacterium RBG_16_50_9]|nr:MAG: hypothetical protein A2144_02360 [Chloroflexi bacterium RBG_16_50_9]
MNILFKDKVALVTGGSRGIGFRCAELLAGGGAKLAIIGRDPDNLAGATAKIQKIGAARGYQLDVADLSRIDGIVKQVINELGEIDILVCSAGINQAGPRAAVDITETEWDRVMTTNLKGLFFMNKAVARHSMIPRKTGAIVNISSQASLIGLPNCAPYASSKAGVNHLTRLEALEWAAYNIRVNAVAPTWTLTDLVKPVFASSPKFEENELSKIPLRRFATVDDVANAVCFLASDAAGMITGITLPVDGGRTI